jgi:hypothetical protein
MKPKITNNTDLKNVIRQQPDYRKLDWTKIYVYRNYSIKTGGLNYNSLWYNLLVRL